MESVKLVCCRSHLVINHMLYEIISLVSFVRYLISVASLPETNGALVLIVNNLITNK